MAICNHCGNRLEENAAFCPVCGAEPSGQTSCTEMDAQQRPVQEPVPVVQPVYMPVVQQPKTNGLAIAGFVCSIVGWFCCGITSIIGLILSIVALSQIKNRQEGGKGLAIAGIVIGGIVMISVPLGVIFAFLPALLS